MPTRLARTTQPNYAQSNNVETEEIPLVPRGSTFNSFVRAFDHEVLKNLTPGIRLSPIKNGRVAVSMALFNHLKENYNVCGRFRLNQQFLIDFQIIQTRMFGQNLICQMDRRSFALRLAKRRKIKYFNEEMQQIVSFAQHQFLCFKFIKENIVI